VAILHCIAQNMRLSEPTGTTKICMKIDPYYWRQKCSPMDLDRFTYVDL